ncbi:MAG TPA: hypothetical protein VIH74_00325 [Candidatus Acidoferrum sp.]|jgi:hypothetical protein
MQFVDGKLYGANMVAFRSTGIGAMSERSSDAARRGRRPNDCANFIPWLKTTSAAERLLALMLAAFVVTASPALMATIRSTVSLSLQILLQVGHAGFIAFQIFGR